MSKIRIGISGWRHSHWRGTFYPPELPQPQELAYAAARFASIELNGSFYSLQRPSSYQHWREATPPGFVFSVKGSRYITHILRLVDVDAALANFFGSGVLHLAEKLGPLLWQLPPSLAYEREPLEHFLGQLPRDTAAAFALAQQREPRAGEEELVMPGPVRRLRHALEVRHPSFVDAHFIAQLRRHGVALVIADAGGRWPQLEDLTADFAYVRLHGDGGERYTGGYGPSALDHWARRLRAWSKGGQVADASLAAPETAALPARDVYCYFDNSLELRAPYDARALAEKLQLVNGLLPLQGGPTPQRGEEAPRARTRAPQYRRLATHRGQAKR